MRFYKGKFCLLVGSTEARVPACGMQEKDLIMVPKFLSHAGSNQKLIAYFLVGYLWHKL